MHRLATTIALLALLPGGELDGGGARDVGEIGGVEHDPLLASLVDPHGEGLPVRQCERTGAASLHERGGPAERDRGVPAGCVAEGDPHPGG